MSITLSEAQTHLAEWLAADSAIAKGGQSYSIGNRAMTRVDAPEIRAQITFWRGEVARLEAIQSGASNGGVLTAAWR